MKTVVLGLFDQIDDARRVLAHLATLPLDMDAIQVVHPNPDTQREMAAEAGLPPRQGVRNGAILGALAGAALGFMASSPGMGGPLPLLADLGPLLTLAAGAVLGAGLGAAGGALSETVRLPEAHQQAVIDALSAGATVVMVHTESLPTAKALGDLFRDSGSRVLPALAEPEAGAGPGGAGPAAGTRAGAAGWPAAGPLPPSDAGRWLREDVPAEHQAFAPPWRRGEEDSDGDGSEGDVVHGSEAVVEDVHGADEGGAVGDVPIEGAGAVWAPVEAVGEPAGTPSERPAEDLETGGTWAPPAESGPAAGRESRSLAAVEARAAEAVEAADTGGVVTADGGGGAPVAAIAVDVPLADLDLPPRIARPLVEAGIVSLAQLRLAAADPDALLALRGIGPAAVGEIRRVVEGAESFRGGVS